MKSILASTVIALAFVIGSVQAAELDLGSLRMEWPDGYKELGGDSPIQLVGPDGTGVLITVWKVSPEGDSSEAPNTRLAFSSIAESNLPKLAAAQGKVVVSLQQQSLPSGSVLYSTATKTGSRRTPEFYLQYMLVAPSTRAALFSIEGRGEAIAQHARFREYFDSAAWLDAR